MNKVFNFNESPVTFCKDKCVMINATEMAKAFGKRPVDWTRTEASWFFINAYTKVKKCTLADIQIVRKGGDNPGTWFHKDIAMEFARWLSPEFAIWCNDKIEELLIKGSVSLNVPQTFSEALQLAADLQRKIEQDAPKVEYHDKVLSSENGMTTSDVAKELGMSARKLNATLSEMGVQFKQGGSWKLYAKYQDKEYMTIRTTTKECKDDSVLTFHDSLWTEKGRKFIHELLNK